MKIAFNNQLFINLLFCLFPVSFILGNQATNSVTLVLTLYVFIVYKKQIFNINFFVLDKILFLFFAYIFFTLLINYFEIKIKGEKFSEIIFYKSIFFYKYLFLYLGLRFLLFKKIILLNIFYLVCSLCVIIVSADIFIQFIIGENILGVAPVSQRHYSGFFGDELIAGGYIQKFSLFAFILPFISLNHKTKKIFLFLFLFSFFLIAIILSGNRMPLILYLLSVFLFTALIRDYRKYYLVLFFLTTIFLLIFFQLNSKFQRNATNLIFSSKHLITTFFDTELENKPLSVTQKPYVTEFYCGKMTIKLNPIFGGGVKSYRTLVKGCETHPHNYYLEIISDLGIVGLLILLFFVFSLFFNFGKIINIKLNILNHNYYKVFPVFLILLMEFFPLRSSGSFFSTNNATIIFIMFAISVFLIDNLNKKNYRN